MTKMSRVWLVIVGLIWCAVVGTVAAGLVVGSVWMVDWMMAGLGMVASRYGYGEWKSAPAGSWREGAIFFVGLAATAGAGLAIEWTWRFIEDRRSGR